jgi:large subunit ribosomal protein L19e
LNLRSKRRLAASVLGVGKDRIIFDPEAVDLIEDAITRSTIRGLLGLGAIKIAPKKGVSRGRARVKRLMKRARGHGSFAGGLNIRVGKKDKWISKVRALRFRLKVSKERGEISNELYWKLYRQVKGGQIKDVKHLINLMKEARR